MLATAAAPFLFILFFLVEIIAIPSVLALLRYFRFRILKITAKGFALC
jgi:hypothetical protein